MSRNTQYADVKIRTTGIPECAHILKANLSFTTYTPSLLMSSIWGQERMLYANVANILVIYTIASFPYQLQRSVFTTDSQRSVSSTTTSLIASNDKNILFDFLFFVLIYLNMSRSVTFQQVQISVTTSDSRSSREQYHQTFYKQQPLSIS